MKDILIVMEKRGDDLFTIDKVVPIQDCVHPSNHPGVMVHFGNAQGKGLSHSRDPESPAREASCLPVSVTKPQQLLATGHH